MGRRESRGCEGGRVGGVREGEDREQLYLMLQKPIKAVMNDSCLFSEQQK